MNFLRLSDPLLSVLFEDDDIIAIDKAYGFNAHTNDSKIEHSNLIQDGLIEIYEKTRGQKLHIIHRLDQTTTGVMIFGKSAESAKKYAAYFFNRQVQKTYWFITKEKSQKNSFQINQKIIHKARELDAETDFSFVKRTAQFELWKAHPHTGRNHQIRIHAQAAGLSLLGDEKYGGAAFSFLCLHNQRMQFPNGIAIESRLPIYFEELKMLEDSVLARAFFEADRRQRLFTKADTNECFRLAQTEKYAIDQFGEKLFLSPPDMQLEKKFLPLAKYLHKTFATKDESWSAKEQSINYEFHMKGESVNAVSLNQRLHRQYLLKTSKTKEVLVLFSGTSMSGLAAALGEAGQVTCVDLNKNSLNRTRESYIFNALKPELFQFYCRDSLQFLEQCIKKERRFDLIYCDAPAFMRGEKGIFKIENEVEELLENCLRSLNIKGELLFSTGSSRLFIIDIRNILLTLQKKLSLQTMQINNILPALDFELPDEKVELKSFLVRV